MARPKYFGGGKEFFNTKERNKAVVRQHLNATPIYKISEKFDLSAATVERIVKKFERGNTNFDEDEVDV